MNRRISRTAGFGVLILIMTVGLAPGTAQAAGPWKKRWIAAAATLAAANALDAHSSRGRYEANPLLRDQSGRFDARKAALVKSAASGGFLLLQALLLRNDGGGLYKPFAITTFCAAGAVGATALRNYRTPRAPAPSYLK